MTTLPAFLKKYLWDIDFDTLDSRRPGLEVLVRILEYGDTDAVSWMREHSDARDVEKVLTIRRSLSPRSANYWALIYDIDRSKVRCFQKPYLEMRRRHWPY